MNNPLLYVEKNCAYCNNGSFLMGYKLILPEIFSLSEEAIDSTYQTWSAIVKRLPEGSFIHRFDAYIEQDYDTTILPDRSYFQQAYKANFENRQRLIHYSYVFFGTGVSTLSNLLINPFAKISLADGVDEQNWINTEFRTTIEAEASFVNSSNQFKMVSLTASEMEYFCFDYFNLFVRDCSTTLDFTNEVKLNNRAISVTIGDKFVGAFSLFDEKQLPNELSTIVKDPLVESKQGFRTSLGDLFGLYARKPHYVSTVIFRDSKSDWVNQLGSKEQTYRRYAFMSSAFAEKAQTIKNIQKELESEYNEELIVRSNTTLVYWERERAEFLRAKQYFGSIFRGAEIIASEPVGKHLKNLFVAANPFYVARNSELNVYPGNAHAPLAFYPLVSNYLNDDHGLFFCDRFNIPFRVDLWDERKKHINARNFLMLAPTGEGKSFFLQELLRQMNESGCVLVVIDLGQSFKKFAEILGDDATFIKYEQGKSFGVNPFNCSKEELASGDKLTSLAQFVFSHTDDNQREESHFVFMRKLLKYYIENSQIALSFKSLVYFIRDNEKEITSIFQEELEFFNLKKLKINLSEFIDDGIYAYMYDEGKEHTLGDAIRNKKVVVFEIGGAKENPKILSVYLQLIKDTIQSNIWNDKSKKGVVLYEEFAETLKYPNVMSNVEYLYQAIRKYGGAVGVVLQNTSQIPRDQTADSIFDNMQIIYAIRNKNGYEGMKDRLKVKDSHSIALLNSLQNNFAGERKYSEVYIKQGERERVVRLEVSRKQYLAFITDGPEAIKLQKLTDGGKPIRDAIEDLI